MRKTALALVVLATTAATAGASMKTETVTYKVGDTTCKGYLAYDDATKDRRPGVLVVHEFWGLNEYARKRAEQLAGMGYVAFACDMYGEGKVTEHPKEASEMAGAVRKNQEEWKARALAGLKVLQDNPFVDAKKVAALGYCFGGSTALKLAYSGADLAAVVSFHGALPVPTEDEAKAIKAKVLICQGALDTFIPEKTIAAVRDAFEKARVDYELIYLGGAVHSLTVPGAETKGQPGIAYNAAADRRSWAAMNALFHETFGAAK